MRAFLQVKKNQFPRLAARFPDRVAYLMNQALLSTVYAADKITPVDTGLLRANKTLAFATSGNFEASVTWNQEYGVSQEYGTARMAAQPFAQPAADKVTPNYLAQLAKLEALL